MSEAGKALDELRAAIVAGFHRSWLGRLLERYPTQVAFVCCAVVILGSVLILRC